MKPRGIPSGYIYQTSDYDMFTTVDGNRRIRPIHLTRLQKSMGVDALKSPIIVNEKMQVIDGQHRLSALRNLGKPVYYFICDGYGLSEVHRLNSNMANWTSDEFMNAYADRGFEHYIVYRNFKERWGWSHKVCRTLLTGVTAGSNISGLFNGGELVIDPEKHMRGDRWAKALTQYGQYYEGYKRRSFVYAMVNCFKNPEFSHKEFLKKLKVQPTRLKDCGSKNEYLSLIERVYNYHRCTSRKIRLY